MFVACACMEVYSRVLYYLVFLVKYETLLVVYKFFALESNIFELCSCKKSYVFEDVSPQLLVQTSEYQEMCLLLER